MSGVKLGDILEPAMDHSPGLHRRDVQSVIKLPLLQIATAAGRPPSPADGRCQIPRPDRCRSLGMRAWLDGVPPRASTVITPSLPTLLRALKALDSVKTANADQKAGVDIVRRAIQVPARQIVQNAGEDGSLVVGKLLENSSYNWGFNAATGEYQDLVKAGVIDPAKVVRTALQDAASVASLLITTEALVADKPKKAEAPSAPPMDF